MSTATIKAIPDSIRTAAQIRDWVNHAGDKANEAKPGSARKVICQYVANLTNLQGAAQAESPFERSTALEERVTKNVTKVFELRSNCTRVAQDLVTELDAIAAAQPEVGTLVTKERGVILDALEGLRNGNPENFLDTVTDALSAVEKMLGKTDTTGGAGVLKDLRDRFKKCVTEARTALANLADRAANTFSKIAAFLKKPIPILERGVVLDLEDLEEAQHAEVPDADLLARKDVKAQCPEVPDANTSTSSTLSGSDFSNSEQEVPPETSDRDTTSSDSDFSKGKDVPLIARGIDEFFLRGPDVIEIHPPEAPNASAAASNPSPELLKTKDTTSPEVGITPRRVGPVFPTPMEGRRKISLLRTLSVSSQVVDPKSESDEYDEHPMYKMA